MSTERRPFRSIGPCPLISCGEQGPHEHAVCPTCGAIRYGNPFHCLTCNVVVSAERIAHGFTAPPLHVHDLPACCPAHRPAPASCCDPDDCGPCCPSCPTCPSITRKDRADG